MTEMSQTGKIELHELRFAVSSKLLEVGLSLAHTFSRKWLVCAMACVTVCVLAGQLPAAAAAKEHPPVVVRGPTIVAFFPPVTQTELEKDPDTNEALSDFQFYSAQLREPLRRRGIEFHELYAHSFQLRIGKKLRTFQPVKGDVGYYLIAPGRSPRIEYGVMTDVDLLEVAKEYFGVPDKLK